MRRSQFPAWHSLLSLAIALGAVALAAAAPRERDKDKPARSDAGPASAPKAAKADPPPRAERSAPAPKVEAPRRVETPRSEAKPNPAPRVERAAPKIELKPRNDRPAQVVPPPQVSPRRGPEPPKIDLPGRIEVQKPDASPRTGGGGGGDNSPRRIDRGDAPRGPRDADKGPKIDLPGRPDGNKGAPGAVLPKPGERPPRGNDGAPRDNLPGLRNPGDNKPGLPGRDREDNKPGLPSGRDDKKPDGAGLPGPRDRGESKPNLPGLPGGNKPGLPGGRDDKKPDGAGLPGPRDRGDNKPNLPGLPGVRDRGDNKPGLPGLPGPANRGDMKPGLPGGRDRDDNKPGLPGPGGRDNKPGSPGVGPGAGPGAKDNPRDGIPGLPGMKDRDGRRDNDLDERLPRLPGRDNDGPGRDGPRPGRDGLGQDGPGRDGKPGLGSGIGDRDRPDFSSRPVKQIKIDPTDRFADHVKDARASEALKNMRHARNPDQLQAEFAKLRGSDAVRNDPRLAAINLDRVSGRFQVRLRDKDFDPLVRSRVGQQYQLDRQFHLLSRGDVARQMRFNHTLVQHGGWQKRHMGPVFNRYTHHSFSAWYPGPRWYPRYCWQPVWSPWVRWSFWNNVLPIYDPRPFVVRPIFYDPCPPVIVYQYPVWQPLPIETAGTWIDVPPVVIDQGNDLQLLAVRFVDPGHTEENLGPRFRVWIRNNTNRVLQQPIDVTLFASNDRQLSTGALQAGVTMPEIPADTIVPIDIRLPVEVNKMAVDQEGNNVPFQFLHAVVDSRNVLPEADKANNGAVVDRGEIFPVDPAAFSTDVTAAAPGTVISLAGEGLGPEPGEIIVTVGDQQQSAEIRGWYDLGVQFTVPNLNIASASDAQIIVIRGDGAASNPVPLNIAPENMIGTLPMAPVPGLPGPAAVPALDAPLSPIN